MKQIAAVKFMSKLSLINSQSYYHWRLNEVKIHKHFHISKNVDLFSAHFFFCYTFWYTSSYIIGNPFRKSTDKKSFRLCPFKSLYFRFSGIIKSIIQRNIKIITLPISFHLYAQSNNYSRSHFTNMVHTQKKTFFYSF